MVPIEWARLLIFRELTEKPIRLKLLILCFMIPRGKNRMSDEVSALGGVTRSEGIAKVTEMPLQGMVTVRGDLSDKVLKKAILAVTKLEVPVLAEINQVGEYALCWMSPDELLLFCPYASVEIILAKLNKSLLKTHSLVADISDARTIFCVSGSMARDVIAKLAPVDISPKAFQNGMFRRSRLAQVFRGILDAG